MQFFLEISHSFKYLYSLCFFNLEHIIMHSEKGFNFCIKFLNDSASTMFEKKKHKKCRKYAPKRFVLLGKTRNSNLDKFIQIY